jgi:hypothetical protein
VGGGGGGGLACADGAMVGLDIGTVGGRREYCLLDGEVGDCGSRSVDGREGGDLGSTGEEGPSLPGIGGGTLRIGSSVPSEFCGISSSDSDPSLGEAIGAGIAERAVLISVDKVLIMERTYFQSKVYR